MSRRPLKLGLIGAGGIARTHVVAVRACEQTALVGICDVDAGAAQALAATDGCPTFTDLNEMLDTTGCEAAIVCTPPNTHLDIALALFERGIHVLCEKPLTIDPPSARQMIAAAKAAGVTLTMASKFRFVADVVRAKALIDSGLIGEVLMFENHFTAPIDMSRRWNSQPHISGGGVLIDNGTHSVDIAHYFLGPLVELQAVEHKRFQNLPVEDTVTLLVRNAAGVVGRINLSWSLNLERRGFINLIGTEGNLVVGWQASAYQLAKDKRWVRFGEGYDKLGAFVRQLENFVDAIRGSAPLRISAEDALASVEVIDLAYRAMANRRWEPVSYARYHDECAARPLQFKVA